MIISLKDDSGAVVNKMTTTNFIDKMHVSKRNKIVGSGLPASKCSAKEVSQVKTLEIIENLELGKQKHQKYEWHYFSFSFCLKIILP